MAVRFGRAASIGRMAGSGGERSLEWPLKGKGDRPVVAGFSRCVGYRGSHRRGRRVLRRPKGRSRPKGDGQHFGKPTFNAFAHRCQNYRRTEPTLANKTPQPVLAPTCNIPLGNWRTACWPADTMLQTASLNNKINIRNY